MYEPKNDGIDHINMYSKGKTELGRLLTNLSHTPFEHPEHGHFESVEGFWYFYLTGCKHEHLKGLYGIKAKLEGKKLRDDRVDVGGLTEQQKKDLLFAIRCKLNQNKYLLKLIKESELPFAHYYFYGDENKNPKVYDLPQYNWIVEYFEKARTYLKEKRL